MAQQRPIIEPPIGGILQEPPIGGVLGGSGPRTIPQRNAPPTGPDLSLGGQLFQTATNTAIESAKAAASPVLHPIDTAAGIATMPYNVIKSHMEQGQKAYDAFQRGDRSEAVLREIAAIIPVIGPMMANYFDADQAGKEQIAGGGIAAAVTGKALAPARSVKVTPAITNRNPVAAEAVRFGERAGIPVNAGTATGNRVVQGAQYLADRSLGGAIQGQRAEAAEQLALGKTGRELAAKAHPKGAVSPFQAGEAMLDGVKAKQAAYGAEANAAYDTLRAIENDPSMTQKVSMRVPTTAADGTTKMSVVTMDMQMPVNLRLARERLRPVYERMRRQMPVAQQHSDAGLKAIQNIMEAPDYLPASMVDMDLSAIKAMSRAESPGVSKALLGKAIESLDYELHNAVSKGGQKALNALAEGRQATISKAGVTELLKQMGAGERQEPVQIFTNATWRNDAGIERLKKIADASPESMPKLGRAFVDNLMDQATTRGGYVKADSLASQWEQLGPQTKRLMFPDAAHRADLDNFFRLSRQMAQNPNPSGTAAVASILPQGVLLVTEPVTGVSMTIAGAALAKLLHSPAGVRAITQGLRVPIGGPKQAALSAFSSLSQAIGDKK